MKKYIFIIFFLIVLIFLNILCILNNSINNITYSNYKLDSNYLGKTTNKIKTQPTTTTTTATSSTTITTTKKSTTSTVKTTKKKYEGINLGTCKECDKFDDKLKEEISKVNNTFMNEDVNFAYYYYDIETGFTLSYNPNKKIAGVSTIKSALAVYIYDKANKGEIDLDEKLVYDKKYYDSGSGILKKKDPGDSYTIRELTRYSIRNSDNIAYAMLLDRFGLKNVRSYFKKYGISELYKTPIKWTNIVAKDGYVIMKRFYDLYNENPEGYQELYDNFLNTTFKLIKAKKGTVVLNKYGGSKEYMHDFSIVYAKHPYILIILTKRKKMEYRKFYTNISNNFVNINELYHDYLNKNN